MAAIIGVVAASPSAAEDIPTDLSPTLTYQVRGQIAVRCSLSGANQNVTIDNLASAATSVAQARSVDLGFDLACNTPVLATMKSSNGGLLVKGAATSDPDFQQRVTYRAALTLPNDGGEVTCRSDRMAAEDGDCRIESTGLVTQGSGRIRVTTQPGSGPLLAGEYSDRVTLIISPVISGGT